MARRCVRGPHGQRGSTTAQSRAAGAAQGRVAIEIRPEQPADYDAIGRIVEAAFGDPNVARLVELIRDSEHYVAELSLVAEQDGAVVGHVMFSYVALRRADDEQRVLILSPLAVSPAVQRAGIGSALVYAGIAEAEARAEPLMIVEGIPSHYPRFGFERARPLGLEPPSTDIPDAAFMVRKLSNYGPSYRGTIVYPPAFDIVTNTG